MERKSIVILGAGGLAREVFWHARDVYSSTENFIFVDDVSNISELEIGNNTYSVVNDWDFSRLNVEGFIIGVGSPQVKMIMVDKALKAGLRPLPTVIHSRALVQDPTINCGLGGFIGPGCILTTNIKFGDYVVLNLNCTIGHDAEIGDYVTVNPGCQVSGNCYLGKGASLGTGTVVKEKTFIAEFAVTGAQAAIVRDIVDPGVYAGVPAQLLKRI